MTTSPLEMKEFEDYIANGGKLKMLNQYFHEDKSDLSFIDQLLKFVRPEFREVTHSRYSVIEPFMAEILDCLYRRFPEDYSKQLVVTQDLYDYPKRVFLSGGFAAYLIGRFASFTDIDIYVTFDTPPISLKEYQYFWNFGVTKIPGGEFGIPIDLVRTRNDSLNDIYKRDDCLYGDDHLPLFYMFDFPEISNFIEITPGRPLKIYVEECDCLYQYFFSKRLELNYPMRSAIVNNYVSTKNVPLKLYSPEKSKDRLIKYSARASIRTTKNIFLNYLKPTCIDCIDREQILSFNFDHCKKFEFDPSRKFLRNTLSNYLLFKK